MAANTPQRRLLGGTSFGRWLIISGSSGIRSVVFDLGDRLEIEERDHWNILRRRIPLREVVLVTKHIFRRVGNIIAAGILTCIIAALCIVIAVTTHKPVGALIGFLIFGGPFLIFALWCLFVPITEIQIQSRRVTARIRFGIRKAHGDSLCQELLDRIQKAQAVAVPNIEQPNAVVTPVI